MPDWRAYVYGYAREAYHDIRMRLLFILSPYSKSMMIKSYWQMDVKTRVALFRIHFVKR